MKTDKQYRKESEFANDIDNAIATHTMLTYEQAKRLVGTANLKSEKEYHDWWLRTPIYHSILPEFPDKYYKIYQ